MTIEEMKAKKIELGYSNKALAKESGVPLGTVQKIFSGETKAPRMDTITARLDREEAKAIGENPDTKRIEEKKPDPVETPGPRKEITEEDYLKMVGNVYEYDYEEEEDD